MLREFKEFLEKFKVLPVAIAFVLAAAFKPVIDSVVALITAFTAVVGLDLSKGGGPKIGEGDDAVLIPTGDMVNATISFILVAFVVFMIIKALNKAGADTDGGPTADQQLLAEIRDTLQQRR